MPNHHSRLQAEGRIRRIRHNRTPAELAHDAEARRRQAELAANSPLETKKERRAAKKAADKAKKKAEKEEMKAEKEKAEKNKGGGEQGKAAEKDDVEKEKEETVDDGGDEKTEEQ